MEIKCGRDLPYAAFTTGFVRMNGNEQPGKACFEWYSPNRLNVKERNGDMTDKYEVWECNTGDRRDGDKSTTFYVTN